MNTFKNQHITVKTRKTLSKLMALVLFLIQGIFLLMAMKENFEQGNHLILCLLASSMLLVFIGSRFIPLYDASSNFETFSIALWIPLGAAVCYTLSVHLSLGSVLAAGITGTLASFIPLINKQSDYLNKMPVLIYCGAFVGMTGAEIAMHINFVIAAGVFAAVIYMLSKNVLVGFGGKLGTIAFGGVLLVSFFYWLAA